MSPDRSSPTMLTGVGVLVGVWLSQSAVGDNVNEDDVSPVALEGVFASDAVSGAPLDDPAPSDAESKADPSIGGARSDAAVPDPFAAANQAFATQAAGASGDRPSADRGSVDTPRSDPFAALEDAFAAENDAAEPNEGGTVSSGTTDPVAAGVADPFGALEAAFAAEAGSAVARRHGRIVLRVRQASDVGVGAIAHHQSP